MSMSLMPPLDCGPFHPLRRGQPPFPADQATDGGVGRPAAKLASTAAERKTDVLMLETLNRQGFIESEWQEDVQRDNGQGMEYIQTV